MHDDFRLLGRDVHIINSSAIHHQHQPTLASPVAPSPIITQAPPNILSSNSILQSKHVPPPALSAYPTSAPKFSSPTPATAATGQPRTDLDRTQAAAGYTSDSSLTGVLPQASNHTTEPKSGTATNKALLAALAHSHRAQLRREERERAREKVARRLERERERERALTTMVLSDCESVASAGHVSVSGSEKTRRVYGGLGGYTCAGENDSDATTRSARGGRTGSMTSGGSDKTLVPSAEEIWG